MKASDLLVRCLENEQVQFVFGLPGEETLDLTDSLRDSRMRVITVRHEQGAAFMANVHGRLTGKAGVCLATLGPGATNLLTGVADANLDRVPLVAITGQTSLDRLHKESHQSIDVPAMFKPVTKWNAAITRPYVIPEAVRKAFKVAQTEKPGATHLELPEDVAAEAVSREGGAEPLRVQAPSTPEPLACQVQRAIEVIGAAERPVILAGNGVVRKRAHEAVRRFARAFRIPVVHTFMGKGILPDADPLSLYAIGLRLRDYPARVVEQADLVLAVGYDFVEYAPCLWNADRNKRIVHLDASPAEVDQHYIVEVGVLGDLALCLDQLGKGLAPFAPAWAEQARATVAGPFEVEAAAERGWPMRPQQVIHDLRGTLDPDDLVVCDVGAHKLWMGRMFPCAAPNTCIISNGFAAMGIGLPGAIAAKLLFPGRRVVAVAGDGGFLMSAQELETAVRLNVPVVVLVWRDGGYGVIRWKQMRAFGRTASVDFGNPDLVAFAESFGAAGFRVGGPSELSQVLKAAWACGRPAVVDCPVAYDENLRLADRLDAAG